jgi:hypothetical protein
MFIKSVKLFAIGTLGSASAKIHPREQIRFAMALDTNLQGNGPAT